MPKRVLLIDADVVAYNACTAVMQEIEYEPGYYTWQSSFSEVLDAFDTKLASIKEALSGDEVKLCLTDSDGNFRRSILPTYKGKRGRKPLVLKALKEYLVKERQAYFKPGLEGDDCMGILATMKHPKDEKRIIVSIDKDMKQIPGFFSRDASEVVEISEAEADLFHMMQTLTGDSTDGYSGCPGIGKVKAEAILSQSTNHWASVVRCFEAKGLTEEDALVQARVARILRATDYDFEKKEPILWQP